MPKPRHSPQDCLENNKEKRDEWERKNGKKWTPYRKHIKKKKNGAKDEGNDSKNYFDLVAFSMPAKSNTVSRDRWLFDIGADEHIANSLEKFDTYEERMDLPFMNTANGLVRPQGCGLVRLFGVKGNREKTQITLHHVIYMPSSPVCLFSGKKLYNSGGHLQNGQLLNKHGNEMGIVDSDLFLYEFEMEAKKSLILPSILPAAIEQKNIDIELWHRRLCHLGLDNVRKTKDMVNGISYSKEGTAIATRLCQPCEEAKPMYAVLETRLLTYIGVNFCLNVPV
jgi:hypothetical protein